jgi:hypothetical protein
LPEYLAERVFYGWAEHRFLVNLLNAMKLSFFLLMGLVIACQAKKPQTAVSRLDSAIAVRIKQWTNLPDSYQGMGTVRIGTVLQVEWLTQEAQRRQQLASEYQQVKNQDRAQYEQEQMRRLLQATSELLTSHPDRVHHYEYLHTCRLRKLDGTYFEAQYYIEADTTDQLLQVRRHR